MANVSIEETIKNYAYRHFPRNAREIIKLTPKFRSLVHSMHNLTNMDLEDCLQIMMIYLHVGVKNVRTPMMVGGKKNLSNVFTFLYRHLTNKYNSEMLKHFAEKNSFQSGLIRKAVWNVINDETEKIETVLGTKPDVDQLKKISAEGYSVVKAMKSADVLNRIETYKDNDGEEGADILENLAASDFASPEFSLILKRKGQQLANLRRLKILFLAGDCKWAQSNWTFKRNELNKLNALVEQWIMDRDDIYEAVPYIQSKLPDVFKTYKNGKLLAKEEFFEWAAEVIVECVLHGPRMAFEKFEFDSWVKQSYDHTVSNFSSQGL